MNIEYVKRKIQKSRKKNFGIMLNPNVHKEIKKYCISHNCSISHLISNLLTNFLNERNYEIHNEENNLYEYILKNYNILTDSDVIQLITSIEITEDESNKIYELWSFICKNNYKNND